MARNVASDETIKTEISEDMSEIPYIDIEMQPVEDTEEEAQG